LATGGLGMMMSALFMQHEDEPMHQVEAELARAVGTESGILAQSGFAANVGLIQSIADERVPVYVDMLAHASLWEGIKSAGAKPVPILHNDLGHLERHVLPNSSAACSSSMNPTRWAPMAPVAKAWWQAWA